MYMTIKYNTPSVERANHKKFEEYRTYKKNVSDMNKVFKRSEFICAICGKQPIEKHHENYDLWWSFIPLCKECHKIVHGKKIYQILNFDTEYRSKPILVS